MFLIRKPSYSSIKKFLSTQQQNKFSYSELGATRSRTPADYVIDHNRCILGYGDGTFGRASEALQRWHMFDLGWVEAFPQTNEIKMNVTVAVLIHHFGFWSLNACRIVYVLKEDRRFGFAYGTLSEHAEQGEERFSIEWSSEDDSVWYDILAFSRPRQWQARIVRPVSRFLQKKFARHSMDAMRRFCSAPLDKISER